MKKITTRNLCLRAAAIFFFLFLITSWTVSTDKKATVNDSQLVAQTLDQFNEAAAQADFNKYFNFFTEDAIFIGTDATENWNKKDFMVWAKPMFDKKKTWNFKAIARHIFFNKTNDLAWFDELLDTQMKICRGSGVLIKQGDQWKVQHYVLSMTMPNEQIKAAVKIKAPIEDELIRNLTGLKK